MALFGLASIPLAFERVAALPAPQPQQLVEATLGFLTCGSDPGRKNATMFLAATLHFRVILDEFDAQVGQKASKAVKRPTRSPGTQIAPSARTIRIDQNIRKTLNQTTQGLMYGNCMCVLNQCTDLDPASNYVIHFADCSAVVQLEIHEILIGHA